MSNTLKSPPFGALNFLIIKVFHLTILHTNIYLSFFIKFKTYLTQDTLMSIVQGVGKIAMLHK